MKDILAKLTAIAGQDTPVTETPVAAPSAVKKALTESQEVDEASAAAMGRAAEMDFANWGPEHRAPLPRQAPAVAKQEPRKYIVRQKATGRNVSVHKSAPEAVAARNKLGNVDAYAIIKEGEENTKFGVFQSGGSVGEKKDGKPQKTFDTREEAAEYAKRRNKQLSPGEKGYYKLKYTVKAIADKKAVTENIGFNSNENRALKQLARLPQPITVNGGAYGYRCDVTKKPLQWIASDGSPIERARTLHDIGAWLDDTTDWFLFLDGRVDLEDLIADRIVRPAPSKPRQGPESDQEDHELKNMGLRDDVQMNELSTGTVGNYKAAAKHDLDKTVRRSQTLDKKYNNVGRGPASMTTKDAAKQSAEYNRIGKRSKGLGRADARTESKAVSRPRKYEVIAESVKFRVSDPSLAKVLRRFPHEVSNFEAGADLGDHLYDALYDHYCGSGEMPYGTMKARDGDPFNWVSDKLNRELEHGKMDGMATLGEDTASIDPELQRIMDKYPYEAKQFSEFGEMDDGEFYQEIYDHYLDAGEMPYGVAKARTGDPVQWVANRLEKELGIDGDAPDFDSAEDLSRWEDHDPEMGESIGDNHRQNYTPPPAKPAPTPWKVDPINAATDRIIGAFSKKNEGMGGDIMPMEDMGEDSFDPTPAPGEAVLNETSDEEISAVLTGLGFDEGLDFFFDNGLVMIGKSNARVAINALKNDPSIGTAPTIESIDGEEVRIAFNSSPVEESLGDDFAAMARGMKNKDGSPRFPNVRQGPPPVKPPTTTRPLPMAPSDSASGPQDWYDQSSGGRRNMGDSVENNDEAVTEDVNMSITANGEDDVLAIIKKLSGMGVTDTEDAALYSGYPEEAGAEVEVMGEPSMRSMADMIDVASGGGDNYAHDEMDNGAECEIEVEGEGEYTNAPNPEVHTSTTAMINQGNDLNRPKRQFARTQPGDNPMAVRNPMAETRALMQQYNAMKNDLKSK